MGLDLISPRSLTEYHSPSQFRGLPSYESSPNDGAWLCDKGPYLDLVQKLCVADHSLRRPNKVRRFAKEWQRGDSRVLCVQLSAGRPGRLVQKRLFEGLRGCQELREHMQNGRPAGGRDHGMLYVMEGLAPDYVSVLGHHLGVPPSVFANQARVLISTGFLDDSESRNNVPLPSLREPKTHFSLVYPEARHRDNLFGHSFHDFRGNYAGNEVYTVTGDYSETMLVRHTCSFWSRSRTLAGWEGM